MKKGSSPKSTIKLSREGKKWSKKIGGRKVLFAVWRDPVLLDVKLYYNDGVICGSGYFGDRFPETKKEIEEIYLLAIKKTGAKGVNTKAPAQK